MKTNMQERKEYYTTYELVRASWFPVNSVPTVIKLIEQGRLKAWDIGTIKGGRKRYRISEESVNNFLKKGK